MGVRALFRKIAARILGGEYLIRYLQEQGMKIGKDCRIFADISTSESYLIEIGDNTTISGNVTLITHDASIQKVLPEKTDIFGKIKIGSNCFVGHGATILYGVTIADGTIIAAGSVVTRSVHEEGLVIAGNPARVICDGTAFAEKYRSCAVNIRGLSDDDKRSLLEDETIMVQR